MAADLESAGRPKPSVEQLGVDPGSLAWQRTAERPRSAESGAAVEVAFPGGDWVLLRTPGGPVLVFTRFEWDCFLDGVKKGEFDDAAS